MLHVLNRPLGAAVGVAAVLVGGVLSGINHLLGPLYTVLGAVLAFWYGLVPDYAAAIALFTITVMVVLAPLTVKSTRSMFAMQRLQPEMKKIQAKYKGGDRQAMNEELQALYKEHGVSPLGGCLPLFIQLPVFFVLYEIILGLTSVTKLPSGQVVATPKYISHNSLLYHNLVAAHGHMMFLGFDLGKTALHAGGGFLHSLPYWLLIAVCIGLQYLQMRQMTARTPQQQEGAGAQMQKFQKFMPLFFGIIYIEIPAGVNIYFLVSSLFRLGQQELMFRYDPQIKGQLATTKKDGKVIEVTERPTKAGSPRDGTGQEAPGGLRGTLRAARSGLRELGSGAGAGAGAEDAGSWGRTRGTTSGGDAGSGRPKGNGAPRGGSNRSASTTRGEGNGAGGSRRAGGEGQASRRGGSGGRTGSQGGRSGTGRSSTERKGSSANGDQRRSRDQEVAGVRGAGGDQRGRSSGGKGTGSGAGDKGTGSTRSQNRSRSKKPRRPR